MIASLRGRLEALSNDWAIIDVNGVGFQVYMPTSTISALGTTGEDVHLHTHLVMREDGATLYGFSTEEELEVFRLLIGVSGLGPRLSLAMLSAMSVEQMSMAIGSGSIDLLTTVPGIGKKMAERLVFELQDKIAAIPISAPAAQLAQENADVLTALLSLGYSASEATRAVATLPASSELTLEDRIKLALQYFGGR